MLVERIPQIQQHHKTFTQTLCPNITMLETLTPPAITQLLFVFSRISQHTVFKITSRPFRAYISRGIVSPRLGCPRNCTVLEILIAIHLPRRPIAYLGSYRIANHTIATAYPAPFLAHISEYDISHSRISHIRIFLIPKRIQIHAPFDAVDRTAGRVLPATVVGGVWEVGASAIAGDPPGLAANIGGVQRGVEVVRVRIHRQVGVAGGLQLGVPGVHDAVVHARAGRRRVAVPCPLLQIIEHRVAQVARLHAGLPQQAHHIVALIGGGRAVIRVRIRVDAERDTQPLAFADVAQGLLVEPVAPAVADADDGAFHTIVLGLLPVDLPLPFGDVDHALGLLHEQRAVRLEERRGAVIRAPVGAVRIVLQGCGPHHDARSTVVRGILLRFRNVAVVLRVLRIGHIGRVVGLRSGRSVPHRILDLGHLNRDKRFAVGFGERIGRLIHRADDLRIGHGIPGLQIHHLAGVGHDQFLRDHRRVVGNLLAHGLRQVLGRIIRHRLRLIRGRLALQGGRFVRRRRGCRYPRRSPRRSLIQIRISQRIRRHADHRTDERSGRRNGEQFGETGRSHTISLTNNIDFHRTTYPESTLSHTHHIHP